MPGHEQVEVIGRLDPDRVLVFAVGLAATMLARFMGAQVIAVDISDYRVERAADPALECSVGAGGATAGRSAKVILGPAR